MTGMIVRAADEGVPIGALVRIFGPFEGLRELLHSAVNNGRLVAMPREDWPPAVPRDQRAPTVAGHPLGDDDDNLFIQCAKALKTTKLETSVLTVLLRRGHADRDQLHKAVEDNRGHQNDPTDIKIVDVVICKMRKKLAVHGLKITTIHSIGYEMSEADRQKAWALIRGG